ncbi:MAG TPA: hypothetical protein VF021_05835 [Longimicrobiales bacterium]
MEAVAEQARTVTASSISIAVKPERSTSTITHLLRDEQGKPSTARYAFWVALAVSVLVVLFDALGVGPGLSQPGYTLLGSIDVALVAWAAGPRAFQYFAPQIGNVASALSKTKRDPRWPNRFKDDERGEEG